MRALAHPVRVALLEMLAHAGTLTATQASDRLGESPANCAFHLRTLARYGYVEEAGGGRGRERPWRRVHEGLTITSDQPGQNAAAAAAELSRFWLEAYLERARAALAQEQSWPGRWRHVGLGLDQMLVYMTPEETRQVSEAVVNLYHAYFDRLDHPERRPEGAVPVQVLRLAYPVLHLMDTGGPAGEDGAPGRYRPGPATGGD